MEVEIRLFKELTEWQRHIFQTKPLGTDCLVRTGRDKNEQKLRIGIPKCAVALLDYETAPFFVLDNHANERQANMRRLGKGNVM